MESVAARMAMVTDSPNLSLRSRTTVTTDRDSFVSTASFPCCHFLSANVINVESSANVSATQSKLISPVTAVRAADGKIAPRKSKPSSGAAGLQSPPVTYMHICETEVFSCSCCGPAPPYRCTSTRT